MLSARHLGEGVMKITVIHGSPRKGVTYESIKVVKEEMQKLGEVEFVDVHLPQDAPVFCKGCFQCFMKGEHSCPDAKYIQPIVEEIISSDGIIVSSPVYALQISGGLKAFFDHTAYCFLNHRPRFFKQKALIVTTTAGAGIKNCNKYISENLTFWGINKIYKYGQPTFASKWEEMPLDKKEKLITNLKKVSVTFYKDVESKRIHSPALIQTIMYNASKVLINKSDYSQADKEYWTRKGWLNRESKYFLNEKPLNIVHRITGKFVSSMFGKVIKSKC